MSARVRILDVGCGDGGFSEIVPDDRRRTGSWLGERGGRGSFGIDTDWWRVMLARTIVRNGTRFIVMDARKMEFPTGYFEQVHGFGVLHHVDGWRVAVREMARVHRVGGVLVVTETVDDWLPYRLARRVCGSWQGHRIQSYFGSSELLAELGRYYRVVSVRYCYRPVVADVLRLWDVEPDWSLRALEAFDRVTARLGVARWLACHVVVEGVRKGGDGWEHEQGRVS